MKRILFVLVVAGFASNLSASDFQTSDLGPAPAPHAQKAAPALPNLAGNWRSANNNEVFTLQQTATGYSSPTVFAGNTRIVIGVFQGRLVVRWFGGMNGQAFATKITPNRIEWSNGNAYTR